MITALIVILSTDKRPLTQKDLNVSGLKWLVGVFLSNERPPQQADAKRASSDANIDIISSGVLSCARVTMMNAEATRPTTPPNALSSRMKRFVLVGIVNSILARILGIPLAGRLGSCNVSTYSSIHALSFSQLWTAAEQKSFQHKMQHITS